LVYGGRRFINYQTINMYKLIILEYIQLIFFLIFPPYFLIFNTNFSHIHSFILSFSIIYASLILCLLTLSFQFIYIFKSSLISSNIHYSSQISLFFYLIHSQFLLFYSSSNLIYILFYYHNHLLFFILQITSFHFIFSFKS
jgi:hypothetical protein